MSKAINTSVMENKIDRQICSFNAETQTHFPPFK